MNDGIVANATKNVTSVENDRKQLQIRLGTLSKGSFVSSNCLTKTHYPDLINHLENSHYMNIFWIAKCEACLRLRSGSF